MSENRSAFSHCTAQPKREEMLKPAYSLSSVCTWCCPHCNRNITDVWQHHNSPHPPSECSFYMAMIVMVFFNVCTSHLLSREDWWLQRSWVRGEGTTTGFSASFSQQSWSSRRSVSSHHLYTGRGRQAMANCQLPVNTWIKFYSFCGFFFNFFQCFSSHLQVYEVASECCKLVLLSMGKSNRQGEQHKIPAGAVRQRGRTPESAQPFLWYSCVPLDGCPWERGDLKLQGLKSWGEFCNRYMEGYVLSFRGIHAALLIEGLQGENIFLRHMVL